MQEIHSYVIPLHSLGNNLDELSLHIDHIELGGGKKVIHK